MKIEILNLKPEIFAPYGKIIEPLSGKLEGSEDDWKFYVIVEEPSSPWRIGYFLPKIKALKKLECHPNTLESFEPVSGISVIILAKEETPQSPQAFLLDKPVILEKGIWHGVISLSENVEIKIIENLEVQTKFHYFEKPLQISVNYSN